MARKKKRGSARKRPLVFTESPVDLSRRFPSPVFAARNPVGAELVPVKDKEQEWVSPQIDPNAPYTPTRRCRTRRNRTACSMNALPQAQRGQEVIHKEARNTYTKLQFLMDKKSTKVSGPCGQLSSDSSTESTDDELTGNKTTGTCSSDENERFPLCELGIAGRTRAQRQRRSRCNPNRLSPKDSSHDGSKDRFNQHADWDTSDQENCSSCNQTNLSKTQSKRHTCTCSRTVHNHDKETDNAADSCKSSKDCSKCPRLSVSLSNLPSKKPVKHKLHVSPTLCGSDPNKQIGRRHSRATRSSARSCHVLVDDTPEADYGIKVSLRRRRKLLHTPARNKLMYSCE